MESASSLVLSFGNGESPRLASSRCSAARSGNSRWTRNVVEQSPHKIISPSWIATFFVMGYNPLTNCPHFGHRIFVRKSTSLTVCSICDTFLLRASRTRDVSRAPFGGVQRAWPALRVTERRLTGRGISGKRGRRQATYSRFSRSKSPSPQFGQRRKTHPSTMRRYLHFLQSITVLYPRSAPPLTASSRCSASRFVKDHKDLPQLRQ